MTALCRMQCDTQSFGCVALQISRLARSADHFSDEHGGLQRRYMLVLYEVFLNPVETSNLVFGSGLSRFYVVMCTFVLGLSLRLTSLSRRQLGDPCSTSSRNCWLQKFGFLSSCIEALEEPRPLYGFPTAPTPGHVYGMESASQQTRTRVLQVASRKVSQCMIKPNHT